jgi:hypothetical protein
MKKQYKVTFIYQDYIAGVFYNESENDKEAIESAKFYITNKWNKVYAEIVDIENQQNND